MSEEYRLQHPITIKLARSGGAPREEVIETVTVRRPKGKDAVAAEKAGGGEAERSMTMIAQLTDLALPVIHEMDLADLGELGSIVEGFMEPGRPTGATSSES